MIDPICGMTVDETSEWSTTFNGKKYYFCAKHCLHEFQAHPEKYSSPTVSSPVEEKSFLKTYYPLILIFAYILGITLLVQIHSEQWNLMQSMTHFMAGFFIVFSFFKFLNLSGFADAYQTYDVLAKRSRAYAYLYPFLELGLGVLYLSGSFPLFADAATVVIMGFSSIGVIQSLMKKRAIQCACLGTVFNLPMTAVTVFEDLLMVAMAAIGLLARI